MCVDFRELNNITINNQYLLPRIDDLLDHLKNVVYFTKLDFKSGYHQIRITESDVWKTSFKTKHGLFEWMVMSFGLCNAPMTFMRVMNDIFKIFIDYFSIIYLNDILVFIHTWKDHVIDVGKVFVLLKREKLYINMSKCEFGKTSLVYLDYVVGCVQLKINPSKVEVIVNSPKPSTATKVSSFLWVVK